MMRKIIFAALFTGSFFCWADPIRVTKDILDNALCDNGVVHKERTDKIKHIIWHYTVGCSYEGTKRTYYERGVSAHYTVNFDGEVYQNVPLDQVAFHAGESAFGGDIRLNECSIGIEQVNPGYWEDGRKYGDQWRTSRFPGSDKLWFEFTEPEWRSTGQLTRELQDTCSIYGRHVETHADIAPSRKVDTGPLYPYETIFKEYGAGFFPTVDNISKDFPLNDLSDDVYQKLLSIWGYDFELPTHYGHPERQNDYEKYVYGAFRMHFCSKKVLTELSELGEPSDLLSPDLSNLEKFVILNLTAGYFKHNDVKWGQDDPYRKGISEYVDTFNGDHPMQRVRQILGQ